MNALYVTVSIPLLLVLAGFNHAHGLSTFGKPSNQGQGNTNPQTIATGKACTNQANCTLIKGTTCLKSFCLCGDNSHPVNGICTAHLKGHNHLCQKSEECVDGADCKEPKEKNKPTNVQPTNFNNNNNINNNTLSLVCRCDEGLTPTGTGTCSGGTTYSILPGLMIVLTALIKLY